MMTGFGMGLGWLGFLLMALFWIAIIVAAVALIGKLFPQTQQSSTGDSSETSAAILKKRYARGEISKEEYAEMRHVLEQ